MIEIALPFPPSSNNLFLNARKGRVLSPEYRSWREHAGWKLKTYKFKPMKDRCVIVIDLDDTRQGDCANREKAVVDLLVDHKVIQGDQKKYVRAVCTRWEKIKDCQVKIIEDTPEWHWILT